LNRHENETPILRLTDGIWFDSGPVVWSIESLRLYQGQGVALIPDGPDPPIDPSGRLARILATLSTPEQGTVEILDENVNKLSYRDVQRLRVRLGFVQGYGGLLSNRTIRDNIALPVSVHGNLSIADEASRIDRCLDEFALDNVANLLPHNVDGATRWRACLARAMVLRPRWLVLEGIGDWEMDRGRGTAWSRFRDYRKTVDAAVAICLSRRNPEFEEWFGDEGGEIIKYSRLHDKGIA